MGTSVFPKGRLRDGERGSPPAEAGEIRFGDDGV